MKRIIILLLGAVVITITIVTVAIVQLAKPERKPTKTTQITLINNSTVAKTASIYFLPTLLSLNTKALQATQTANIILNSGNTPMSGVQLDIIYDSTQYESISIAKPTGPTVFPGITNYIELDKRVSPTGSISYILAMPQNGSPQSGVGPVATLTFTLKKDSNGTPTIISFGPKTLVTKLGATETILRDAARLTISFPQVMAASKSAQ